MNLKYVMALSVALVVASPLVSFANNPTKASSSTVNTKSEGKVLGTMIVLNKNEMGAGELANKKSTNQQVRNFAVLMIREHGKNLLIAENLGKKTGFMLVEDSKAKSLKHKGKKDLAKLRKLKGPSFDKAYIDAMVNGHREALVVVTSLINESSDPKVKQYLSKTKTHVQHHLDKAMAIQKTLQS